MHELLEMDLSPLDYMLKMFPEIKERDEMRKVFELFYLKKILILYIYAGDWKIRNHRQSSNSSNQAVV